jgi:Asp/Glu/hydantoin racemase
VAREEQADMIILGCNGKSVMDRLVNGCVSKEVEKAVKVPVLVATPEIGDCGQQAIDCEKIPARVQGKLCLGGN